MSFKEWLKQRKFGEVATSTASVASFAMPIMPMVRRDGLVKKKKKKKKPS